MGFVSKMAAGLTYEGCNFFRQRLVLATLSGKSVKIKNIRVYDDDPGLKGGLRFNLRYLLLFSPMDMH